MRIQQIIDKIERFAPLTYQEEYDNSGIQIGDTNKDLVGVLISIDITEDILKEAKAKACNLVISHHPLLFKSIKQITNNTYIGRCITYAIQNNICIYACHTNLDKAKNGVNFKIAEKIGLSKIDFLDKEDSFALKLVTYAPKDYTEKILDSLYNAGAGTIGSYDKCSYRTNGTGTFCANKRCHPFCGDIDEYHHENEDRIEVILNPGIKEQVIAALKKSHPYECPAYDIYKSHIDFNTHGIGCIGELEEEEEPILFLKRIKEIFKNPTIKYTVPLKSNIKKVALCGGAGIDLLPTAIKKGADIYLTSDVKYHNFFDADKKIIIADIGHYESEQYTKEIIYNVISEKNANFVIHYSEKITNPIKYL